MDNVTPQEEVILEQIEEHLLEQAAGPQEEIGTCEPGITYALVENDLVTDIFDGSMLPEYNPAQLHIIALPVGEELAYNVGNKVLNGVIEPTSLAEAKSKQLWLINEGFELEVSQLQQEHFPLEEVLSFNLQAQEAQLYLQDPQASTPFLEELAQARGEDKGVLASKILDKHQAHAKKLATLLGHRHQLRDRIEKARSFEEVLGVVYTSPFA
ncbi:hypothetical protein [Helicobacter salomonis]|uniref:hypothetical protein n=1 Tax=Helicobacter salomonis TaxID=56878 RepID=UPI000CF06970|nr:hypothetical protein [Helicobacter salomonis]